MSGVFQIDREIFENRIWNNVAEFRVFFYILGNAVWKEAGVKIGGVLIGKGQYLRSYRNLREDLVYYENKAIKYYSISHIKKITDKLVTDGRIKKEESELGTLFTVVNYSIYQGFERFEKNNQEQSENSQRTEQEQNENNKKKDNKDKKDNKELYKDIVEYLNSKTNKNFKSTSKATQTIINARINEGFTLDDFKKVIDNKTLSWINDIKMSEYLRPQTLFGTKFESYLNEGGKKGGEFKGNNGTSTNGRTASEESLRLERIAIETGLLDENGRCKPIGEIPF